MVLNKINKKIKIKILMGFKILMLLKPITDFLVNWLTQIS